MTDQEMQSLRNLGNEFEAAANEIERLRDELTLYCDLKRKYQELAASLDIAKAETVGAERRRIRDVFRRRHLEHQHSHNFYAFLAREIEDGLL